MKIKKVDDKPMVIHTKEKAKIHAHEPKGAKIKGSNIYTVERGPKTIGATTMYVCTVSFPAHGLFLTFKTDSCIFQLPVKKCAIFMNGLNSGIPFIKRIGALMSKKYSMALAMPLNIWAGKLIRSPYRTAVSCQ
mgnify:CR=1 FL=1